MVFVEEIVKVRASDRDLRERVRKRKIVGEATSQSKAEGIAGRKAMYDLLQDIFIQDPKTRVHISGHGLRVGAAPLQKPDHWHQTKNNQCARM